MQGDHNVCFVSQDYKQMYTNTLCQRTEHTMDYKTRVHLNTKGETVAKEETSCRQYKCYFGNPQGRIYHQKYLIVSLRQFENSVHWLKMDVNTPR